MRYSDINEISYFNNMRYKNEIKNEIKISYSNVNEISYFNNIRYKNEIKNEI
jgi:hypothetical protein